MTRSIMLRTSTLFDLFPGAAGRGVREEAFLTLSQLVALPLRDGQLRLFLRDAVPEVFDELESLGSQA